MKLPPSLKANLYTTKTSQDYFNGSCQYKIEMACFLMLGSKLLLEKYFKYGIFKRAVSENP